MAFSVNKNEIFHQRIRNYAAEMQALREEGQRLRNWYFQEISGSNLFIETPIATPNECINMITYIEAFESMNTNVQVAAADRKSNLVPFLATAPAV